MRAFWEWIRQWWLIPYAVVTVAGFFWAVNDAEDRNSEKRAFCYQLTRTFDDFERCVKL